MTIHVLEEKLKKREENFEDAEDASSSSSSSLDNLGGGLPRHGGVLKTVYDVRDWTGDMRYLLHKSLDGSASGWSEILFIIDVTSLL